MKASEMIPGKRYIIKNEKFLAVNKRDDVYVCYYIKNNCCCVVPFDCDVEYVMALKGRINQKIVDEFVNTIKNSGLWYKENKDHIRFLKDMVDYKIYIKPQRVLTRKPLLSIKSVGKYKNGYYAYKLKDFLERFDFNA